ncbi:hypothetical protein Runsl_1975 [Runella slithyformis DSM 19594]|uniref:Uncharacterized protein n=1 Tax=Runella slithyformis (strain ATCC 29530 / DSM 19594 / LMG 11500 / NCIMB 11436 / LSU 4) TaxID=761193 RepID=A0A7U4E5E9_RUNSL|nr:hypothetical protein Runsl_1975 [Runella slithyformis DSM 19594]
MRYFVFWHSYWVNVQRLLKELYFTEITNQLIYKSFKCLQPNY